MIASEMIEKIYDFKPESREELRDFYQYCREEFDKMADLEKEKVRNSMLLEMLERASGGD